MNPYVSPYVIVKHQDGSVEPVFDDPDEPDMFELIREIAKRWNYRYRPMLIHVADASLPGKDDG